MAVLPLLRESAADLPLASWPKEQQSSSCGFGPSDVLFSPRQIVSGLLPPMRPIRVCAVRFAVGSGTRLPRALRTRARRFRCGGRQGGMAASRCALWLHGSDNRLGLDPLLARV